MPLHYDKNTTCHTVSIQSDNQQWLNTIASAFKARGVKVSKSAIFAYAVRYLRTKYSSKVAKDAFPRMIAKNNSKPMTISLTTDDWLWLQSVEAQLEKMGIRGVTRSSLMDYALAYLKISFKSSQLKEIQPRSTLVKQSGTGTSKKSKTNAAKSSKHTKRNAG
jgi:hypothetical protein